MSWTSFFVAYLRHSLHTNESTISEVRYTLVRATFLWHRLFPKRKLFCIVFMLWYHSSYKVKYSYSWRSIWCFKGWVLSACIVSKTITFFSYLQCYVVENPTSKPGCLFTFLYAVTGNKVYFESARQVHYTWYLIKIAHFKFNYYALQIYHIHVRYWNLRTYLRLHYLLCLPKTRIFTVEHRELLYWCRVKKVQVVLLRYQVLP